MNELTDYIKSQKEKEIEMLGFDVDFSYIQKPRLTKENKQYKDHYKHLKLNLKI